MGHYDSSFEHDEKDGEQKAAALFKAAASQVSKLLRDAPEATPDRFRHSLEDMRNWLFSQYAEIKPKKATGVWVLTVEHDWGSRGKRRETEYYFSSKPSDEDVEKLGRGAHFSLTRRKFAEARQLVSYAG